MKVFNNIKNKNIGARVIVQEIIVEINPKVKWRKLKNIHGTIVEREGHEQYYHTCSGSYISVNKHIIEDDCYKNYAIKLDNDCVDIEGNNIIVVREHELKFLDYLPQSSIKIISKKQYNDAKKIIEQYEYQQNG